MKTVIAKRTRMFVILVHVLMHADLQNAVLMPNVLLDSILINVYALKIILEIQQ
jgi:hypothetical protein